MSQFVWLKARDRYGYHCKACRAEYGRGHYAANKSLYKRRAIERKRREGRARTKLLFGYFAANPCTDCGEHDPVVLEFDHLRDKRFTIGGDLAGKNWKVILEEIAKCEVVCANCHRRRTAQRVGTIRAVLAGLVPDETLD